ncbi:YafY family protein [Polynucleobacter sp. MWH-UH2A]|uniref:helix-turn-helix transcriptional regulator n=1 Tax=Polynucleobacter sp. MWH-UH2A TaxID=1855617 RepID=UPI001BFE4694|nr:WYL domain-containing protein [Polynucleobacter sp. MWH-UH2A]QWD63391.1 WYL domain-containing protein [Polynucleobacter sp. MWH-UH2A]
MREVVQFIAILVYDEESFHNELAQMNKKFSKSTSKTEKEEKKALEVFQRRWDLLKRIPSYEQDGSKEQVATVLFARYGLPDGEGGMKADDLELKRQNFLRYIQSDIDILQRALKDLGSEEIETSRGKVWWNKRKGSPFKVAGFGLNETIAFGMLKKLGSNWLPSEIQKDLEPYYEKAIAGAANLIVIQANTSTDQASTQTRKWLTKLEQWPDFIEFKKPTVKPAVQRAIYESLLHETRLEIKYKGREEPFIIHPHLLVQRGVRTYLFATDDSRGAILHSFLLNRISQAKYIGGQYKPRSQVELKSRLDRGIAVPKMDQEIYGKDIELKMVVDFGTALLLGETPIGRNQLIKPLKTKLDPRDDDLASEVTTTIKLQEELVWWLRSMTPHVKVLAPTILVERMRVDMKKAAKLYS